MIELLGVAITGEMLIALGVAFAIDELLPFLPTKYNGIAHAVIMGIKKARFSNKPSPQADKLDQVLEKLQELQELQETGGKIDSIVRNVRGR